MNSFNLELQLKNNESANKNKLIDFLSELKGLKFVITLVLDFKKIPSDDKTLYSRFYLNSKAEKNINESDINDVFKSIYTTVLSNIQKYLVPGSGWIINLFILQSFNNSKYNLLAGSSYIKIPKE